MPIRKLAYLGLILFPCLGLQAQVVSDGQPATSNVRGAENPKISADLPSGGTIMARMMAACGVLCSECAAYLGRTGSPADREQSAAAWHRIYGLIEKPENLSCGGCVSSDEEVFHSSRTCRARLCCRSKGFANCAECDVETCVDLKKAQSAWDGVPDIAKSLSRDDFVLYARPWKAIEVEP